MSHDDSSPAGRDADIQRLAALRDSGQISAEDFERLKQAILDASPADPAAAPTVVDGGGLPPGREKPVHPAGEERVTPSEPAPESTRDPRQAFQTPIAATTAADEPPAVPAVPPEPVVPSLAADADGGGAPPPSSPAPPDPFERYPLRYGVLYPERLSRWKTAFRLIFLLPLFVFRYLIGYATAALAFIGWTCVFWRKKYPTWAFRGVTGLLEYDARFFAYGLLQTDKFPSIDRGESLVRLDFAEPMPGQLSRWRVLLWKVVLLIPHFVVLAFLSIALFVVTILAWFGILFTGNYPRGMFGFASGVTRWYFRVTAYFLSLNDRFPPFALSDEAGAAGRGAAATSGIIGGLATAGVVAAITVGVIIGGHTHHENVSYAGLKQGHVNTVSLDTLNGGFLISLTGVDDPGDDLVKLLSLQDGERMVVFHWKIANLSSAGGTVSGTGADLTATVPGSGGTKTRDYAAQFLTVGDRLAPRNIASESTETVDAVFILPAGAQPAELHFYNGFAGRGGITYRFQ